jgi:hypothetical protein
VVVSVIKNKPSITDTDIGDFLITIFLSSFSHAGIGTAVCSAPALLAAHRKLEMLVAQPEPPGG